MAGPVRSKAHWHRVNGVPTDFVWSLFADQLVLIITQVGAVGTVISTTLDTAVDGSGAASYNVSVLLGRRDEPCLELLGRQIAGLAAAAGCSKPVLLCLGLKEPDLQSIRALMDIMTHNNLWS